MSDSFPKPAALFPRPPQEAMEVQREPVSGPCQGCGEGHLEGYRVLRVNGWKRVVRCPDCLAVARSEDSPTPLGFTYVPFGSSLRHQLDSERDA